MWETAVRKQDFLEGDKSRETGIWFVWEETGVGKQVSWLLLESGVRKQESGNRCLDSFWNQVSGNRCLVSFWKQVSGNTCLDSFWKQVSGNRCLDSLWKQVSGKQVSGFNCHWALNVRKQMSKYPMSHVLTERKCLDTGVGITLVWVTGDPHPTKYYLRAYCPNVYTVLESWWDRKFLLKPFNRTNVDLCRIRPAPQQWVQVFF